MTLMVNGGLIRRTVRAMEAGRDRWDQRNWVLPVDPENRDPSICNTTMCFAGFAMAEHMGSEPFLARALERADDGCWYTTDWATASDGLEEEARVALGLDDMQARCLFGSMTDNLDEYKALITKVTGVAL